MGSHQDEPERRVNPANGIVFEKIDERGSLVIIRPVDTPGAYESRRSRGMWITWSRA